MVRIWYGSSPCRWPLLPFSVAYRFLFAVRRMAYRSGLRRITQLPVPVVVVGNLTVGGTGKTPLVIWLAQKLGERGLRVGIVSRGYGGRARTWPRAVDGASDPRMVGDEPVLMARLTGCPVSVGPDRVRAAQALLERAEIDVLLSDDGLQHYALGRNMEIMVVDGERGLGNGHCLPAGPLREPRNRLAKAGAVVVNGGNWQPEKDVRGAYRSRPGAETVYRLAGGECKPLEAFRGARVHAVAAIGHPERYFRMLEAAGIEVIAHPLPDHARIRERDVRFDDSLPVLVTEKDAVKCEAIAHDEVWCVPMVLQFEPDASERLVDQVLNHVQERPWIMP